MRKTMRLPYNHIGDAYRVLAKILAKNYYSALLPQGFSWQIGRVSKHRDHYHLVAIGWTGGESHDA